MKTPARLFTIALLLLFLLCLWVGEGEARAAAFVTRDGLDRYYQYQYEELLESYVLSILTGEGELYRHYASRRTKAIVDEEDRYLDYSHVLEAYAIAVITGQPFDLDTYLREEGKPLELPPTVRVVRQESGGLVEDELWVAQRSEEDFLGGIAADKLGPLPVLTRVRWQVQGQEENLRYIWYIYRDGQHMRTFRYGEDDILDFVPTDPGVFQIRAFAVNEEGYATDVYSAELVMMETVVIGKPDLDFREPFRLILDPVENVIQHHMANPTWDVYQVHNFHRTRIHWLDETTWEYWIGIGYNYWIGFDGTIYETRGRHYGSHAGGNWNGRSLGVGYQGDFTYQEMTDEQVMSGAWLVAKLLIDEGLGTQDILGHRDVGNTACPGKNFRSEEIIAEVTRIFNQVFSEWPDIE